MMFLSLLFIVVSVTQQARAILDGRVTPIYLENRYTFTNFEWAKGNVFFNKGFDLPSGGTVFIDITQEVNGNINCKNGTIILFNDLSLATNVMLTGSGFIDARGRGIFLESDWTLSMSERFIFTSTAEIIGNQGNRINLSGAGPTGGISFTKQAGSVFFKNIQVGPFFDQKSFFTNYDKPQLLYFNNVDIILNIPMLELASSLVGCYNMVNIVNSGPYDLFVSSSLDLYPYASLAIGSAARLKVRQIRASDTSSTLILDNAQLEYLTSGSYSLIFTKTGLKAESKGRCLIKGRSSLFGPAGSQLGLTGKSKLICDISAQLAIASDIRLSCY